MDLHTVSEKKTDLSISFYNNYLIQFTHQNGNKGILMVDAVSPAAVRKLEYIKKPVFFWPGTPESLNEWNPLMKQLTPVAMSEKRITWRDIEA